MGRYNSLYDKPNLLISSILIIAVLGPQCIITLGETPLLFFFILIWIFQDEICKRSLLEHQKRTMLKMVKNVITYS